ncbi:MAG: hypothetical protein AB7T63_10855 [Planctomycetota bacterium]
MSSRRLLAGARCAAALALLVAVGSCGEEPTRTASLQEAASWPDAIQPPTSSPRGEAVTVHWWGEVGERYEARLDAAITVEERPAVGAVRETSRSARWTLLETTTALDDRERPLRARLAIGYEEDGKVVFAGSGADGARLAGSVDRSSRRKPMLLWPNSQNAVLQQGIERLDGLGIGASAPWVPPGEVHVGDAWPLGEVEGPLDAVPSGWTAPPDGPWRSGAFRVEAIEGNGEDAVVVVSGAIRTSMERPGADPQAPIRFLEDLEGTARIAARTGRPVSFELKTIKRTRQGRDEVVEHGRLRGTIRREGPPSDR